MTKAYQIRTVGDARDERVLANLRREHAIQVREARAKVKRWKQRVAKFGGEIHKETLARMEANLAELLK